MILSHRDKNISIYTVDPKNPYRRLIVGFIDDRLEIYVSWNRGDKISQSNETTVGYKIDNGSTWYHTWFLGDNKIATFMPFRVRIVKVRTKIFIPFRIRFEAIQVAIFVPFHIRIETIRALMYAREFTVSVYPFSGDPKDTASFRITGFHKAVNFVLDAWRRAGSPVPAPRRRVINPVPAPPTRSRRGCFLLLAVAIGAATITASAIWFFLY